MSTHEIIWTKQFKKDIKRQKRQKKDFTILKNTIELLSENKVIPEEQKPHQLTGYKKKHFECHIEPDWLLIWTKEKNSIYLTRTGSHSDLFN